MKKSDTGHIGAKKSELGRFSLQCERSLGCHKGLNSLKSLFSVIASDVSYRLSVQGEI